MLFATGFIMCATILVITVVEKFAQGGWITLAITGALVALCFRIKGHYLTVARKLAKLQTTLEGVPKGSIGPAPGIDVMERTAAVLVGGYGGLGIHTVQSILKTFPGIYRNFVFVSVGVVDSGAFKGEGAIETVKEETEGMLRRYVTLGVRLGVASTYRCAIGTDIVQEASELCERIGREFSDVTFFTGKIIFEQERWYQRILHNETGLSLQKRLQLAGHTMVVLPAKVA